MSAFTGLIFTETVAAVAALVTVCLLLVARVCGKKARRETPFSNLLSSSRSHILESTVVELAVLASVVFAFGLVSRWLERTILTPPRRSSRRASCLVPQG